MKGFIAFGILFTLLLSGCTAKEFNEGAQSIANDISNAFNQSKDTSK